MIVTKNTQWADRMRHLSTQAKKDPFTFDHDEIGYNYRLTNVLSAIGVAQMEQLPSFIEKKRKNAEAYQALLKEIPSVRFLQEQPWATSNCWYYTIQVPAKHKDPLLQWLNERGIQARPIWKLMHTLSLYTECESFGVAAAEQAWETGLNIPCSVSLTEVQIQTVVNTIGEYFLQV